MVKQVYAGAYIQFQSEEIKSNLLDDEFWSKFGDAVNIPYQGLESQGILLLNKTDNIALETDYYDEFVITKTKLLDINFELYKHNLQVENKDLLEFISTKVNKDDFSIDAGFIFYWDEIA